MVIIWNFPSGDIKHIIETAGFVYCLKQINEKQFAFGSNDGSVYIHDMNSFELISTLNAHERDVVSIESLSNGYFASSSLDGSVAIWNMYSYNLVERFTPFGLEVFSVKEYASQKLVVCGNSRDLAFYYINSDGKVEYVKSIKEIFQTNICKTLNVLTDVTIVANTEYELIMVDVESEKYFLESSSEIYKNLIHTIATIDSKLTGFM